MGMDQYLLIPFLGGWTSIYQLFWGSPGVQGFDPSPHPHSFLASFCLPQIWRSKSIITSSTVFGQRRFFFSVQLSLVGSVDEFLGLSLTAHWKRTQGFSIAFFTHQQLADWPLPGPTGDLLSIEHRWFEFIFRETHDIPLYPTVSHCIFPHAVCLGLCSNPKLGTKSCSYSFLVFRKDFRDCPSPMDPDYISIIPHCWTLYKLFYNSPFKSASNVINTHWIPFKFPFKSHSNPIQIPIQIPFKSHSNSLSVLQTRNVVLTILPKAFLLFPSPQCQHLGPASPVDLTWKYWLPSCIYIYIYYIIYNVCILYI